MFNSLRLRRKFAALLSLVSLLFNIAQPVVLALTFASPAYADEPTVTDPTPTPEPTVAPEPSPATNPDPTIAPPPSVDPTPTPDPAASPDITPAPTPSIEPSTLPSDSPAPAPSESPAPPVEPTPSVLPNPPPADPNEQLHISVIENTSATSIEEFDLEVTETGSATLATDKADYAPTDTALITGAGFLPDTTYSLTVSSSDDPATSTTVDVTTDADGTLFYAYQLDGIYRPNYKVEAYLAGSLVATITFTDANPSASLDQYANDNADWVNGNLGTHNSTYYEGDVVPYRMLFDNLSLTSHTITIEWDTSKSDKHATDYLASYDATESPDPCEGVSGCSGPGTIFPIPKDPQVDNGSGSPITQTAGNFIIFGGAITGVSSYSYPDGVGFTGDKSAQITITFNASQANPVLAWGGHISDRADWGTGNSAVAIPGSPYHMRNEGLDGSGGNQDRSLSASAVIFPASITIIKQAILEGSTSFPFTASPSPLSNFSLIDDGTSANTQTFSGIVDFQAYIVAESTPATWTLNSVVCSVTSANGGSQTVVSPSVEIDLKEGENITCTFTNEQQAAHLIVIKHVINDNGGTASASDFTMTINDVTATSGNSFAGQESPGTDKIVTPGSYSVTESGPAGYTDTYSPDCTGTIAAGETKTCTITNDDQQAYIIVDKTVTNDNGGTAVPNDFLLTVDGNSVLDEVAYAVNPGAHTVGETLLPGYSAGLWGDGCDVNAGVTVALGETKTCTITNNDIAPTLTIIKTVTNDNGGNLLVSDFPLYIGGTQVTSGVSNIVSANLQYTVSEITQTGYLGSVWGGDCNADGTITLAPGNQKTCTITNNDVAPTLTFIKLVNNNYGGTLGATNFPLYINRNLVTSGQPNTLLANYLYTLTETQQTGYTGGYFSGDCSADGTISLLPGQSATCTIINNDVQPKLTVTKVVVNDNGGTKDISEFPLFVDQTSIKSGAQTGFNVGTYTVSESNQVGYTGTITGDCDINGLITLEAGDIKSCTITNDDNPGTLIVNKVTIPTDTETTFSITATGSGAIQGSATRDMNDGTPVEYTVDAGVYDVTEAFLLGWSETNNTCNDVLVTNGGEGSCTITNTELGSITIIKQTNPDGSPQLFDFALTGGVTGSAQLSDGQSDTFNDLMPGNYTITETIPTGWSSGISVLCGDASYGHPTTLSLAAGQDITCTFTNTRNTGSITITKLIDADGNLETDDDRTPYEGWIMDVDPDGPDTNDPSLAPTNASGQTSASDLKTGTYWVSEDPDGPTDNYHFLSSSCILNDTPTGGSGTSSFGGVAVAKDQTTYCTFINARDLGTINGYKFNDHDGNGEEDQGDEYLADWNFDLKNQAGEIIDTTTSTVNGFSFTDVPTGSYLVCEQSQVGWTQTYPTNNGCWGVTVTTDGQLPDPVIFGNRGDLSITACKYEDSNGPDEGGNFTPVSGWDFTLGQTIQNTGESNCTTFSNLTPGTYDVTELPLLEGWLIADDSQGTRRVVLTDDNQTVNFYNYQKGSISGAKWDDQDGDGEWGDEPTLPDWHIQLFTNNDGDMGDQVGEDAVTNSDGYYSFTGVEPGDYFVCEAGQEGWIQTYPDFDSSYPNCHEVTITSGDESSDHDFGNFRLGQIYGFKYQDTNGDGYWDEGEQPMNGWEICLDNEDWEGEECTTTYDSEDYGDGYFEFTGLEYGEYTLTEDETNPAYSRTQPESGSYVVTIESGSGFGESDVKYFGNAPLTNIHGYKWNDQDGDGSRGEGEDLLGDWTIFLDANGNEQLDEGEDWTTTIGDEESDHFGWYTFDSLLPGDYVICEVQQELWDQTFPLDYEYWDEQADDYLTTYCHHVTLPNDDRQTENGTFGPEYHFGNQQHASVLTIEKSNDATGAKNPGDSVIFTLIVRLTGSPLYNVQVTDLPAAGFTYRPGSWTAVSSIRGDLSSLGEPSYASPGVWTLGDMVDGEVVTLTYVADIAGDIDGGLYRDLAYARACPTDDDADCLLTYATGVDSEYISLDLKFVGTDVEVVRLLQETGTVNIEGQVLGASTELPATGANTGWLILALGLLVSGLTLIFGGRRLRQMIQIAIILTVGQWSLVIPPVMAADDPALSVRLESPLTPTRDNTFSLVFTTLDTDMRAVTAKCFVKVPGGSFTPFDTVKLLSAGGGSDKCAVTGSLMSTQGEYQFYVTASAGAGEEMSGTVAVLYDNDGPGRPTSYSKDHPSECRWVIKFHTADDGGLTQKVEIYSSKDKNFDTHAGTLVGTVSIGSNQDGEFIHDRGSDCGETWYYVIRAFDSLGNQSAHIGDEVTTTLTLAPSASPTAPGALIVPVGQGSILGEQETTEPTGTPSGIAPATDGGESLIMGATEAVQDAVKSKGFWLVLLDLLGIGLIIYVVRQNAKKR